MAEIKFLSLAGLTKYDSELKAYIGKLIEAANGDITAVEALVNTLIGSDSNKSVRTIANEELAKQLIPENAKEALDTLAEIAAWIQGHPDDVATMNAAIAANKKAIEDEAARADAAEKANAKAIADEKTRAEGKEGELNTAIEGLDGRVEELEGLFEGDNSVDAKIAAAQKAAEDHSDENLATAKTYAEGKASEAQAAAEATAAADATTKVDALKNTAVSATNGTDITVTLGGTVGAPTVTVAHNFVAVTDDEVAALFAPKA